MGLELSLGTSATVSERVVQSNKFDDVASFSVCCWDRANAAGTRGIFTFPQKNVA